MRVVRRRGQFGTQVEFSGPGPARERLRAIAEPIAPAPQKVVRYDEATIRTIELARILGRPIHRGGGGRDPLPGDPRERPSRDRYVGSMAFSRETYAWIIRQCRERGLNRSAFIGMLVEAVEKLSSAEIDDLLARE
jgi:hypothetical protein